MHEVRVTVPRGSGSAIAKAALEAGTQRITVCPVHVIDSHADAEIVSVETSTPRSMCARSESPPACPTL